MKLMDNKMRLIFVFLLFFKGDDAYNLKRTIARLNYVESRLNDELKIIREDLSVLFHKLESIELKLGQAPGKTDIADDTTDAMTDNHVTPLLVNRIKSLLNAFEDEKAQNIIFRREISNEIKSQSQANIGQMKESLRKEVKIMENYLANNLEDVQEEIAILRYNDENLSQNLGDLGNRVQDMQNEVYQNDTSKQSVCVNVTPTSNKIETSESMVAAEIKKYTSCLDIYKDGIHEDGLFQLHIPTATKNPTTVYCDMTMDGGGWTVFQRRQDGSVDFDRDWKEYRTGFGNLEGEFWLGNENLHALTHTGKTHQLRIDLRYLDKRAYVKYETFKVGSESTNYKLEVSGYTGNAGDLLMDSIDVLYKGRRNVLQHNGMSFSTKDRGNYFIPTADCAVRGNGGWWYHHCSSVKLNSLYEELSWHSWENNHTDLKFTEMKLR